MIDNSEDEREARGDRGERSGDGGIKNVVIKSLR